MVRLSICFVLLLFFTSCEQSPEKKGTDHLDEKELSSQSLIVLGIAQDAGYPQTACKKSCCTDLLKNGKKGALVSSIAVVDRTEERFYIFDASPDFPRQLASIQDYSGLSFDDLGGLFITHAHIGHYTGLMYLGRESVGAKEVPVFCMPRMSTFLAENGPWSQLVDLNNISIEPLVADSLYQLGQQLKVEPVLVPHRGEFSETVGYKIYGSKKTALFIPDIDKWSVWNRSIVEEVKKTDYVLIDATFYANGEIPGRDMSEIPHPFVEETVSLLDGLTKAEKSKVHFIHLNHTNPLLRKGDAYNELIAKGYNVAYEGLVLNL